MKDLIDIHTHSISSGHAYSTLQENLQIAKEKGLKYLGKYNVYLVTNIIQQRGISDFYEGEQRSGKISLMTEIENKMSVKKKYRLGYNSSEALVTMCRTPNNTFLFFGRSQGTWKQHHFPDFRRKYGRKNKIVVVEVYRIWR